jgi:Kef-type K+ transport system membrane component KefB
MTPAELSVAFFWQMFFILAVCRLAGMVAQRCGQPAVVGEMVAGVLIGPSLFGLVWPEMQQRIFPAESLKVLYVVAQLGIGLYMFLVGVELKRDLLGSRIKSAVAVSISGMAVPFALGALLALWLMKYPGLFADNVTTVEAGMFFGAAMAITAFPMLARIIHARGLTGTALGTLVLAAGAIGDAAAWCVLAVVLAMMGDGPAVAVKAIAGGAAFTAITLSLGRVFLAPLETATQRAGKLSPALLAVTLMLFTLAAFITDALGLHSVLGGFLLGVAMPRGKFSDELKRQLEPFTVVFLLPIFFTFSGLNTRLDMVNRFDLILIAVAVLIAACVGKGVACWGAARLSGEDHRTALAIGTLMNARGLMELIILNIGLQKGIIQPPLFSVMVLMAVVTTLMASPVFELVYGRHARMRGELRGPVAD